MTAVQPMAVQALRTLRVLPRQTSAFAEGYRVGLMIGRLLFLMTLIALIRWGFRKATSRSR